MEERTIHRMRPVQGGTGRTEQIQGLLDLASHLQGFLVPVQPAAGFRYRLRHDLVAEAGRRYPGRAARLFRQYRKVILIGAAAVGSLASVAGVVVAVILRQKHARSTHAA